MSNPMLLQEGLPVLLQLGVGGIFALLLIDRVLNFVKSRNGNGSNSMYIKLSEAMIRQTAILEAQTETLRRLERKMDEIATNA